jgi:hypothetical protein
MSGSVRERDPGCFIWEPRPYIGRDPLTGKKLCLAGCEGHRGSELPRRNATPGPGAPHILEPGEVDALMAALRTERDWAMVRPCCLAVCAAARCSACGSEDLGRGEWRVFIAVGKGGH